MYSGTGPPRLIYGDNHYYDLPTPVVRDEVFVPETTMFENRQHILIPGAQRHRFKATYQFGEVETDVIDQVFAILNQHGTVRLIPHNDVQAISYRCVCTNRRPSPLAGSVYHDQLELQFTGTDQLSRLKTVDNIYKLAPQGHMFRV